MPAVDRPVFIREVAIPPVPVVLAQWLSSQMSGLAKSESPNSQNVKLYLQ